MTTPSPHNYKFDLELIRQKRLGAVDICIRHFDIYNLSLYHCLTTLCLCTFAFVYHMPTWRFWLWLEEGPNGYLLQPTPFWASVALTYSTIYFIYDTWCIYYVGKRDNIPLNIESIGYYFHHVVCVIGLFGPVLNGVDGTIALLGFIGGELSNPPRGIVEFVGYELYAMRERFHELGKDGVKKLGYEVKECVEAYNQVFNLTEMLHNVYFVLFLIFRFVLTKYAFFVIFFYCKSYWTFVSAFCIFAFSLASVFVIVDARKKQQEHSKKTYLAFPEDDKKSL